MNRRRVTPELFLYFAVFLLALLVRLVGIGQQPLTDPEASLALQALSASRGDAVQVSPQPAYLVFTTAWMFLFGSGGWVARFWPAAAGSLLVLVPFLYRNWLGKLPALFLALFLALDPALLMASVRADGLVMALLFTLLAAALALAGRAAPAGIAAGLALLGGPAVWPGLLGLGLAAWLTLLRRRPVEDEPPLSEAAPLFRPPLPAVPPLPWRKVIVYTLGTLFFAGTLFFTFPQGLSAAAGSLPAYLSGWAGPSGVPVWLPVLGLILYEFFPFLLGLWGGIGGLLRKNLLDRFLFAWWVISFALVLLYPGRQVIDLAWPVVPLAVLATRQAARIIRVPRYDRLPSLGLALLSALILGFISLSILSIVNNPQLGDRQEYWIRLGGAVIMLVASAVLIGWGWSRAVAVRGSIWGIFTILLLFAISSAWNSAGLTSRPGREFWTSGRQLPEERLLAGTIQDLSEWGPVVSGGPDLVVVGIQSPSLRWALRDYPNINYVSQLPTDASPALVITGDLPELALSATYRGQDFILNEMPGWQSLNARQWLRWLAFRTVPEEVLQRDRLVLWARTDLFPGGDTQPPSDPAAEPDEDDDPGETE